jgi:hypothetical protein
LLSGAAKENMNAQLEDILDKELNVKDPLVLPNKVLPFSFPSQM